VSPAPDFAYALCVERIREDELEGIDLSRWRMALNGAEPISPTNLRAFQERFAPYGLAECALTPVYGLSEASLAVTFSSIHEPFTAMRFDQDALSQGFVRLQSDGVELVSVGQPLPGVQVEIRSEAGEALEQQEGRIWVKGPSVMHGYYNRTETPIVDHWLDTGDLGFLFDDHLFVTGRAKDVIILRGRNHAPHAIESAVSSVDGIRTGCVVAVGDIQPEGERLLVFAEVREACEDLGERCAQAIRGQCGVSPDQVHLLAPGTLPRTSSGKLRRGETLRRHRTQSLTTPEAVTPIALASILARGTWRLVRDSRR